MKKNDHEKQMELFPDNLFTKTSLVVEQKSAKIVCLNSIRDEKYRTQLIEYLWKSGILGKRRA